MPSDQSTWLISIPETGDAEGLHHELTTKLTGSSKSVLPSNLAQLSIPSFKTGTLESLVSLSEELPKTDTFFTATVAKTVDTLRNLLNNDPSKLAQHILVNEQPVDSYLLRGWSWNEGRYGTQRSLREMIDVLNKEMTSIDNVMKSKLNNYNLAKGQLTQMQRKKTGNLSVRSLVDIVHQEHFINDSDYLQTLIIAVPKNLVKDWNTKYERLTAMVVPRSSTLIASDDEYSLFSVVIFKRVHDDFAQKCRDNKFIIRDFTFSEEAIAKQREDLQVADTTEKELWTELLQLSRTNFSESFQILVHLKVIQLFIESVLRYGLPAHYTGYFIKPEPKATKRTLSILQQQFTYLGQRANPDKAKGKSGGSAQGDEFGGEYANLLEQEYFDFVLFEIPWIVL
ncbi:ATPase V1 complex subunit C [Dichomitus squalens]|uniref:V-type proton ATPase subunit C n=1 Tax=Dichomitus squalens TaxID=114155 RepID=A0A4Q9QB45_9APHY|nr:ATPase V1 complex subunit C [Dichomitus squalens LYAD-421 SS1]EJF66508.1 ATPase V1 complex subunit C [Dichomitus squalens LYAD-421 SS1]TBU35033.1 ATPase V1 complex subunit C [Dichomitus squalens]TBU49735.1 ATPase V1 complex subunit C [Dichomitus squalens]TBU64849.1 ATPase V1 complex subunit C [Dichomitus squalens]